MSGRLRFDALLLDFDGTVAFTREDVWDSIEYAAASIGANLPPAFRADPRNLALDLPSIFSSLAGDPPERAFGRFADSLRAHYREISDYPKTALYPGIEGILARCSARGVPAYIVTAKPRAPTERILALKGWARFFRGWYSPDSFGEPPLTKAELLRVLLDEVIPGRSALYVGDSPGDVIAARRTSIPVVGVLYGDGDADEVLREKPDYVAPTVERLAELLLPAIEASERHE
jgi:phosphoglycolate phosphatase